jgi:hypothetical protein
MTTSPGKTATGTHAPWHAKDPAAVPSAVQQALREALQREGVAATHFDDLLWIVAQESGGRVGVCNGTSTAVSATSCSATARRRRPGGSGCSTAGIDCRP